MMKGAMTGLFLCMLTSAIHAQEIPKGDLKPDARDVQLIRPSIPPQRYNPVLRRWERDPVWQGREITTETLVLSDVATLHDQLHVKRTGPHHRVRSRHHRI